MDSQHPAIVQWEKQLNESYSAREVTHLFSQTVLQSFDRKAKKLITKMAAESAVIVAISPLAVIDMLASDQEKTAAVMHRRKHIAIVLCVFLICFYVFTEQLF